MGTRMRKKTSVFNLHRNAVANLQTDEKHFLMETLLNFYHLFLGVLLLEGKINVV